MKRVVISDLRSRYGPWVLVAGASEGIGAEFATQLLMDLILSWLRGVKILWRRLQPRLYRSIK